MKKINWKTEKRKISELKEWEINPRTATDQQAAELTKSLDKFNVADPIIINTDNQIIGGHFRYRILKQKGTETVDVRIPDRKLNNKEVKELGIRLNKNTGDWDFDLLSEHFTSDDLAGWGFEKEELDFYDDFEVKEDEFDAEAEYNKIVKPVTKPEDIYELNKHRLICGDIENEESFKQLLQRKRARLIFTDPPYNVNYKSQAGNTYSSGKYGNNGKVFNDNKKPEECLKFYSNSLQNIFNYSSDDAVLYWWFAMNNHHINREALINTGWHISQVLIWVKEHFVFSFGQDYHRCYEPVMVCWKKGKKHFTNKKIGNLQDIFSLDFEDFAEQLDLWFVNRDNTNFYLHPTQKPVKLAERALKKSSQIKDIVLDAFAGSGSTMIACEQLRRYCFMAELDPKYCDVIIKRYIKYCDEAGKEFTILKNGKGIDIKKFK